MSMASVAIPKFPDLIDAVRCIQASVEGDKDGFLLQCSRANWFSKSAFVLGLTRQLGGRGGSVDEYVQVDFDYQHRLDAELAQLRSPDTWWCRDNGTTFAEWLAAVLCDSVGGVIGKKSPVAFEVSEGLL